MKKKSKDNIENTFSILGDKTRFDIILFLATGEKCVCEIYEKLKLPQNLVSHHLGILRHNDLVINRKDGKWIYYALNKKQIEKLRAALADIIKTKGEQPRC